MDTSLLISLVWFADGHCSSDRQAGEVVVFATLAVAHGPTNPHQLRAHNIVDDVADEYDFVIVGGGLAGLVLGARLSEDVNHTVLVLEAGGTGDDYRERIDVPGNAYYDSLWPTPLNWDFRTVPQTASNSTVCEWPRGKVLGGSSAINGLYLNRPGEIEINTWQDLLGDMDGAENWSWDSFFAAMKKSETFTPPTEAIAKQGAIAWDAGSHGTNGPIHYSYPGYSFSYIGQWTTAIENAGIADSPDTYGGANWGAYVCTSAINPLNWTRSYSKSGYLDPLPPRPNYAVLANAHVTRLLFQSSSPKDNLSANAVEYTRDAGATRTTVKVKKEVILAGGTIGSPSVLLYSGIGPKDVLSAAGVPLISELPGVGQHLQDHVSVSMQWNTNEETAGSIYKDNGDLKNDPAFLSYVNDAIAYANASALFGPNVHDLQAATISQLHSYTPMSNSDATVKAGYKSISYATATSILTSPIGLIELLIGNNVPGAIRIGAALQHPFSHGQITISSNNSLDYPVIDPGYLSHPADVVVLREGLKLVRRLASASVQTDAEWDTWMKNQISTEFHPSSTCAMLPLELGGVVDAHLRVYGLKNVRVADASVPPMAVAAHSMGATYGLAERAGEIIRGFYDQKMRSEDDGDDGRGGDDATGAPKPASDGNGAGGRGKENSATSVSPLQVWSMMLAVVALFMAFEITPP